MKDLEPPDTHFLSAAMGWLELGLPDEVAGELDRLSPAAREHPDVLGVEWDWHARRNRWTEALTVADRLLEADHDRPLGWINRSFALHCLRRTEEAHASLLTANARFPAVGVIPYNLACYSCQELGRLEEARGWLRQAMEREGRDVVVERARLDDDLIPLHGELDQL